MKLWDLTMQGEVGTSLRGVMRLEGVCY